MKNSIIKSGTLFALAIIMAAGLNAQPRKGNGQGFGKCNAKYSLDLSEEQQDQMKALRMAHYKNMNPLKNKMGELKAEKKTLMSVEAVDMKLVNKNIDEQTSLMNKIEKLQAVQQVEVKEILTDEQEMMMAGKRGGGKRGGGKHFRSRQSGFNRCLQN